MKAGAPEKESGAEYWWYLSNIYCTFNLLLNFLLSSLTFVVTSVSCRSDAVVACVLRGRRLE